METTGAEEDDDDEEVEEEEEEEEEDDEDETVVKPEFVLLYIHVLKIRVLSGVMEYASVKNLHLI